MAKKGKNNVKTGIYVPVLIMLLFLLGGMLFFLITHTITDYLKLFGITLLFALALLPPARGFWQRLTRLSNRWVVAAIHIIAFTVIAATATLALNYFGVSSSELPQQQARIVAKRSETRYHSRRTGRGRYVRGNPYQVYIIELELPDGERTSMPVSLQRYNSLKRGDSYQLREGPGLLGLTIIRAN